MTPSIRRKFLTSELALILAGRRAGIPAAFALRSLAHVAPKLWGLTLCRANETGHYPVPHQLAYGSEAAMAANAETLNVKTLQLSPWQAEKLMVASMRGAR